MLPPNTVRSALALSVALAIAQMAHAQSAPAAAPQTPPAAGQLQEGSDDKKTLDLERVVVTATTATGSKMKQSLSVSTIDAEEIAKFATRSAAEVLRSIPGIRSESSGGESNANMLVRGLPISAGGARYLQLQEDGLPVLLFGDINFTTADSFLKVDGTLDSVEAVRGGSTSALATNAPGGIVNFITKTGESVGGGIGLSGGLGHNAYRVDADYGGKLSAKTRYFVGGHWRTGEGVRPANVTMERGGQFKANITHDFDGGYIRASLKAIDDKSPTLLPVPVNNVGSRIETLPGIDPRTAIFYSPNWAGQNRSFDIQNNVVTTNVNDGFRARATAFGLEGAVDLGGFKIENRFRTASHKGRFVGIFAADNGTQGTYTIATGPNRGQSWTGRAFTATVFDTSLDDMGITQNDLRARRSFTLGADAKLSAVAGFFYADQSVASTWSFNQYLMQMIGENGALLSSAATSPTIPGFLRGGTDVFGNCCTRYINASYKSNAPYLSLSLEAGATNFDASIRADKQDASGVFNLAVNNRFNRANDSMVDYSVKHTSYSLGVNHRITPDLAVFARTSDGASFNSDRIMFNGYPLNGNTIIPINLVKQTEVGAKWRRGGANLFVTFFSAKTSESNYDLTTQTSTQQSYKSQGIELEASYRVGDFVLTAGATNTRAKITKAGNPALVGNKPNRQADWTYQINPTYAIGPATLGASIIGTTSSWADDAHTRVLPGFEVVNVYLNYQITTKLSANLSANNLFNALGYTEANGAGVARALNGRSVLASVRYNF